MKHALLIPAIAMAMAGCSGGKAIAPLLNLSSNCAANVQTPQQKFTIPNVGITLSPLGRLTTVGNLPLGGAITPDGKQYWAVDSGYGHARPTPGQHVPVYDAVGC